MTRPESTHPAAPRSLGGALRRALALRCPRCGSGGLFASWTRLRERCGGCGLALDRGEEDHFLGAYVLNLMVAESVPALALLGGVAFTWPEVPWRALAWIVVALAIVCPVAFFPWSRTLWLALDTWFRRD